MQRQATGSEGLFAIVLDMMTNCTTWLLTEYNNHSGIWQQLADKLLILCTHLQPSQFKNFKQVYSIR